MFLRYAKSAFMPVLLAAALFAGCTQEHILSDFPGGKDGGDDKPGGATTVRFRLAVPEMEIADTRSSGVNEFIVMAFDASGNMTDAPHAATIENAGTPAETYFTASLEATTDPRRIVIVVNSSAVLNSYLLNAAAGFPNGTWKIKGEVPAGSETQLSHLRANLRTPSLQMQLIGSHTYIVQHPDPATMPAAMSGEVLLADGIHGGMVVTDIVGGVPQPVQLVRAAARFTVGAVNIAPISTDFKILGASLGNAPQSSLILPQAGMPAATMIYNYAHGSSTNEGTGYVPLVGAIDNFTSEPLYGYEDNAANSADNTFVILKAEYKGRPGYYRINLIDASDDPIKVMRNMWYKITITRVLHHGYSTLAEAVANKASNLEFVITATVPNTNVNDDAHDIVSNGEYFLGLSNSTFIAYSNDSGASGNMVVATLTHNAPASVTTASISVEGSGLSLVLPASGVFNPATEKVVEIVVNMTSAFSYNMQGKITVNLGNLTQEIAVIRRPQLPSSDGVISDFATGACATAVPATLSTSPWLRFSAASDGSDSAGELHNPAGNIYVVYDTNWRLVDRNTDVYIAQNNDNGRIKVNFRQSLPPPTYPAFPGVIGFDPVTKRLTIDGTGDMIYFKYGGIIGMFAGSNGNAWATDGSHVVFNPTDITGFLNYETSFPKTAGQAGPNTTVGNVNIDAAFHSVVLNVQNGNGDPCRFVGMTADEVKTALAGGGVPDNGMWRLPTDAENAGFTLATSSPASRAATGVNNSGEVKNGRTFTAMPAQTATPDNPAGWDFLPFGGARNAGNGPVYGQDVTGFYWSPTASSNMGQFFSFAAGTVSSVAFTVQSLGMSVRCVYDPVTAPQSYPAFPGVIGYDPVTERLTIDGTGVMVYFKYGGIIATYSGSNDNTWAADGSNVAFDPTDITNFSNYRFSFPKTSGQAGANSSVGNAAIDAVFHSTVANALNGNGDPCRFVGMTAAEVKAALTGGSPVVPDNATWRLPTNDENASFTAVASSPATINGKAGRIFAAMPAQAGNPAWDFLPFAGHRATIPGTVTDQDDGGYYWSSTPMSSTNSWHLHFTSGTVNPTFSAGQTMGASVRCVHQSPPFSDGADLLYFDGDVLRVGKWANQVNSTNLALFQFGSTIGFLNGNAWTWDQVRFNTTATNTTFSTYSIIPRYNAWNTTVANSPTTSSAAYHHGANVRQGRGDPCMLVGLSAAALRTMTPAQIDAYNSGWRTPTARENALYVGGPNAAAWQAGNAAYAYSNSTNGFWVGAGHVLNPTPPAGVKWAGGWLPVLTPNSPIVNSNNGTFLPAAGNRNSAGTVTNQNLWAYYWSNTPISSANGYYLQFADTSISPVTNIAYGAGNAIRCIRPPVMVFPGNVALLAAAHNPATQTITVTTQDANGYPAPTQSWTLTSSDPWLTLSTNPSGAGAGSSVSGTGAQTVYIVVTANTGNAERRAMIYLGAASPSNIVSTVTQFPAEYADLLYFDGDVLRVGRWGNEVNSTNLAHFQFGSTIGFLNGNVWDSSEVRFNTTAINMSYWDYGLIPRYNAWSGTIANSPLTSDPSYHFGNNVLNGRGDPCQLVGLSAAAIRDMSASQIDAHFSGWRMPTAKENAHFVGGPNAAAWQPGNAAYNYSNSIYGLWTASSNPDTPVPPTGVTWGGGWVPVLTPASPTVNIATGTFFPAAGNRNATGSVINQGVVGAYWSNTPQSSGAGYFLNVNSSNVNPVDASAYTGGLPVRCVNR